MKRFSRGARATLALLFTLSIFTLLPSDSLRPRANAQAQSQTVRLAQLKRPVTVRRDERGIPYIEAENDEDLFFVQGYVTASDRLWQMDLLRRTARGELSEIFGRATLEEDKRRRTLGFARVAEQSADAATPQARAAVEAYARGVNAYIDSLDAKSLPPEFQILGYRPRHWTPADSNVVGKNFAEALSTTWRIDLMRAMLADLPPEKLRELLPVASPLDVLVVGTDAKAAPRRTGAGRTRSAVPVDSIDKDAWLRALAVEDSIFRRTQERAGLFAEDLAASNNWVISGRHTATGKPLLANDPHLAPSAPPIWYMVHLSAPGLRVAGVTAAGAPGVIIGHNERIAWGLTNLGPDVQDLYLEKFDPANPRRYLTPAGWSEAEVRREEIKVRKSPADASTETVTHEVTVTRHGPVIFERDGARYSLRWTALDPRSNEFEGFRLLNRARNWNDFRAALSKYEGPVQNFVYADVDGHIGYYGAGRIPLRKTGDGSVPYDGSTDEGEWTGVIPFNELPHVYDPPSGIIVTANSRIVGTSYPHHLSHVWAPPTRARRIQQMLTAKKKLTVEDFRAVQGDTFSISGDNFAREVVRIARGAALDRRDEKWRSTVQLLADWDGRLEPDSRAALLVYEMRAQFARKIVEGAVGAERAKEFRWSNSATLIDRLIATRPQGWLPTSFKTYPELIDEIHRSARASLSGRLGADEAAWTWGRDSQMRFPHPLAGVPFVGQQFAVQPLPQRGNPGGMASVNVGAAVSMRLIADTADWDRTQHAVTLGQSGLPSSPHFKDQLADWQNVTPRAFPFTPRAVSAAARETRQFTPARP
ncbi:MAG TPA: penicillin acylase family protein [Pyrinomonadaceae bacterium]